MRALGAWHHEAGHAVVARVLGLRIHQIRAFACDRWDEPGRDEEVLCASYAGLVAQNEYRSQIREFAELGRLNPTCVETDREIEREALQNLGGDANEHKRRQRARAEALVGEWWGITSRLAGKLYELSHDPKWRCMKEGELERFLDQFPKYTNRKRGVER